MKGLKKVALASAIAAVSAGAQAELKALDDSTMGEMTGQAGLTIDVETKYTIGEFQYKDAGSVFLSNISLGANTNALQGVEGANADGYLDNFRITLDVAGSGALEVGSIGGTTAVTGTDNSFAYGFAEVRGLALVHASATNSDTNFAAAAGGTMATTAGLVADGGTATGLGGDVMVGVADTSIIGAADNIDSKKSYGDGDLVLHFGFTDAWQQGGGLGAFATANGVALDGTTGLSLANASFEQAVEIAARAVDFNFSIDAIGIAGSDFVTGSTAGGNQTDTFTNAFGTMTVGTDLDGSNGFNGDVDGDASTTVLISNLDINGYLGPADLHIENNGNGFGAVDSDSNGDISDAEQAAGSGVGAANSKITWGSYFNITDLDIYIDIAGVMINGLKINNTRGDVTGLDGTFAFGFAHSERQIYAINNDIVHVTAGLLNGNPATPAASASLVDGIALNTRAKFDMDIEALSFGDTGTSIGNLYWTDVESDTKWTISAH